MLNNLEEENKVLRDKIEQQDKFIAEVNKNNIYLNALRNHLLSQPAPDFPEVEKDDLFKMFIGMRKEINFLRGKN